MKLTPIEPEFLAMYVEKAFMDDTELATYHISPGTPNEMMHHTLQTIREAAALLPLTYYNVSDVGFTVLCEPMKILYSFGIAPHARTSENLKNWFNEIKNILTTFNCILWTKNTRAINHLVKQGMEVTYTNDGYTILTYQPCQ